MKFSFQQSVTADAVVCTQQIFDEAIRSQRVADLCTAFQQGDEAAKRKLPLVTWQASFSGTKRRNADAIPSGLFMLDVDHVENPAQLWGEITERTPDWANFILVAHITPSAHGLRIVARMDKFEGCTTIHQFQQQLAHKLQISDFDACTKDFARASFLVPQTYFLHYNQQIFTLDCAAPCLDSFNGSAERADNVEGSVHSVHRAAADDCAVACSGNGGNCGSGIVQSHYRGIALTDIAQRLIERMFPDGVEKGARNTSLFSAAKQLRYICDFNPEVIANSLPSYGLERSEVEALSRSAVQGFRKADMPELLDAVVTELLAESLSEASEEMAVESSEMPYDFEKILPPIIKDFTDTCPQDFKRAMVLSCLPVLGTVASKIRSRYLDGSLHSPSFFTVVEAPQASGKGFVRPMVETCLKGIKESDNVNRQLEESYRKELRQSKNKQKQPEDPRAVIRLVPASISVARLLQRMDYAAGLHLFTFCEEIDTITKSNRSGSWAQKSDCYRNAFDNANYGQDFMSENSYSANIPMFYNMLLLGTPRAVSRYFRDVEDGLVSRVIFSALQDQAGRKMPVFKSLTAKQTAAVEKICNRLQSLDATFELPQVLNAINAWLETKRQEFLATTDYSIDLFRRRAAVIGFRAGMLAAALWGSTFKKHIEAIVRFALFVADEVLERQRDRFRSQANEIYAEQSPQTKGNFKNLFQALPDTFTLDDLREVLRKSHLSSKPASIIYLWRKTGLIAKDGKIYTKSDATENQNQKSKNSNS